MNEPNTPWQLFEQSAARYRHLPMLIHNDRIFTYVESRDRVDAYADRFAAHDFTMGGVFLPNCSAFIFAMLAINKLGKAFVSLSYQFKGEALIELVDYTDVELLVTDANGWEALAPHADRLNIRYLYILQEDGTLLLRELADKPRREFPGIDAEIFGICFTSGSTSRPKGILLYNRAMVGNGYAVARHLGFTGEDRILVPRSLAQSSPIATDVLMAISRGACIIVMNNVFHPAIFLKIIQDYGATQFYLVRTMLLQTLDYPGLHRYDLRSLKRVLIGGMVNHMSVYQRAAQLLPGVRLYNAYGTSEAVSRVSMGEHEEITTRPCVIGRPIDGCRIAVLRPDGTEAGTGELGEIYIHSEYAMKGYYKSEELTRQVLTPHGIRVRDVGYRDADGLYCVIGRNDDMISQGASRAYPIDIEEVLLQHPSVKEAVVIGVEDDYLGQRIVAFVQPEAGCDCEERELHGWCISRLEARKTPKEFHIVDHIPRNVIGKTDKIAIRGMYEQLITKREVM